MKYLLSMSKFLVAFLLFNSVSIAQPIRTVTIKSLHGSMATNFTGIPGTRINYRGTQPLVENPSNPTTQPCLFGPFFPNDQPAGHGDREFTGRPDIDVTLHLENKGTSLSGTLRMVAEESNDGDPLPGPPSGSLVQGEWTFDIYVAPSDYKIVEVTCNMDSHVKYRDTDPIGQINNFGYDMLNPNNSSRENNLSPKRHYTRVSDMHNTSDPVFYFYIIGNTDGEDFGHEPGWDTMVTPGAYDQPNQCSVSILFNPIKIRLERR